MPTIRNLEVNRDALRNSLVTGSACLGAGYLVSSHSFVKRGRALKQILTILALSALLGGGASAARAQNRTAVPPDNTGVNARDRSSLAVTADQQSNAKRDIELTRDVRRALTDDHSISTAAHNVKIISANGGVTLRGPVNTEREKAVIAKKAAAIAGRDNVTDLLEVKTQQ